MRTGLFAAMCTILAGCVPAPGTVTSTFPGPGTVTVSSPGPDGDRSDRDTDAAVVHITVTTCAGERNGSGFLAAPGTIITNRHVLDDAVNVKVRSRYDKELEVLSYEEARLVDLGVVTVTAPENIEPIPFAVTEPQVGEPVAALGFPGSGPYQRSVGKFLGTFTNIEYAMIGQIYRFDAPVRPGNSGGPLVNDDNLVVGVVYAKETGNGTSLAVPARTVRAMLEGDYPLTPITPGCSPLRLR